MVRENKDLKDELENAQAKASSGQGTSAISEDVKEKIRLEAKQELQDEMEQTI